MTPPRFRHWPLVVLALAVVGGSLWFAGRQLSPWARGRAIQYLEQRFDGQVELAGLDIRLFPTVRVEGRGIAVRRQGRTDVPPIMRMDGFVAEMSLNGLLQSPHEVHKVTLRNMVLTVPPRPPPRPNPGPEPASPPQPQKRSPVLLGTIVADNTRIVILPRLPGREPSEWMLHRLTLRSVGTDRPMRFTSQLRNPRPDGLIDTEGEFGPWQAQDLGATPVKGEYRFRDADMSVFRGLKGVLHSQGRFTGQLERLAVEGEANVEHFAVAPAEQPLLLKTQFRATVDGTSGDTLLHPVKAQFLNSRLTANGGVYGEAGKKGKSVKLDIVFDQGRVEDILKFAIRSAKPPLVGDMRFTSTFELPPGTEPIPQRLKLQGRFGLDDTLFTSRVTQGKVDQLSRMGQGRPEDLDLTVVSDLGGRFTLGSGVLTLRDVRYQVPGARILVSGTYGLQTEAMLFNGTARLDAKPSQMLTGWKRWVAKPFDPLLSRKDAGTVVPIRVAGTRANPQFGVDAKDVLLRRAK